jgi:dTDP-4-dehydrorhamnose reductase
VKALITGGGGQLAADLVAALGEGAHAYPRAQLDVTDFDAVSEAFEEVQPEVVLNCAAFHNLDQCEANPRRAWEVNVEAVQNLASRGVRLVHISTNYVFDGCREHPYAEHDLPAPQSIYALTKLAGEHAAIAYGGGENLVVRTAGLYGLDGSVSKGGNFVQRMLAKARAQGALSVVADQRLQPTFTADLAQSIVGALNRGAKGVVHLTASQECSWHQFTQAILAKAGLDVPVQAISTTLSEGGVKRPLNGVLARPRAHSLGLPALRPWRDALNDYMDRAGLSENSGDRVGLSESSGADNQGSVNAAATT